MQIKPVAVVAVIIVLAFFTKNHQLCALVLRDRTKENLKHHKNAINNSYPSFVVHVQDWTKTVENT